MDLINAYVSRTLNGVRLKNLVEILKGEHPDKKVSKVLNGMVMIDGLKPLHCIHKYYHPNGKKIKKAKVSNVCFDYHKQLGIENVSPMDCKKCHLECALKTLKGEISAN